MWGENHQAQQDCRRACLILNTDGWRVESPAAAAAAPSATSEGKEEIEKFCDVEDLQHMLCMLLVAHGDIWSLCD